MRMALVILFSVAGSARRRPEGQGGGGHGSGGPGFEGEQRTLRTQPIAAGVAPDSRAREDPVAGNDNGDRIGADGLSYGPCAAGRDLGNIGVAAGLSIRNAAERLPYTQAIRRAGRGERQVEAGQLLVEIRMELSARLEQERGFGLVPAPPPVERDDGALLLGYGEIADGRVQRKLGHPEPVPLNRERMADRPGAGVKGGRSRGVGRRGRYGPRAFGAPARRRSAPPRPP